MNETGVRTQILGRKSGNSPRERNARLRSALSVGVAAALFVLLLRGTGLLDLWELRSQDLRTGWTLRASEEPVRPDVLIVSITEDCLDAVYKQNKVTFPWDWDFHALILDACREGKAASVAVDLLLREDREGADVLAKSLKAGVPTWFMAAFWNKGKDRRREPDAEEEALLRRFAVDLDNDGSLALPDFFGTVDLPSATLAEGMAGICTVSTQRDKDGLIRRYHLLVAHRGRVYPSFALAALLSREKARVVRVRHRVLQVGGVRIPVEKDGSIVLRWYPDGRSFPYLKASRVLHRMSGGDPSVFDPAGLAGKAVIYGTSAAGLTDMRVTPVTDVMPGPEIHATALANVLNGEGLLSVPAWISVLAVVVAALAVALAVRHASAGVGTALAAASLAAVAGLSVGTFKAGRVMELVPPLLAVVLAYAGTSALNYLYEGRQRQRIKRDFQKYMSPKVVEKILKNPDALSLEGERKVLTIFFMDFAGFTSMSEKLDPGELVKLISEYHNEAAEEIFAVEGTIDKYVGDMIMAFWNDPIDQEDHALRACRASVAAQKRLVKMAAKMKERGLPEMSARIGVNTGFATVGNMGAKGQVNYTVIGDEVNLASRLEGVNKEFGTDIIISEPTYLPAKEHLEVRELALIKVKGRKLPVRIYELLGLKGEVPEERLQAARAFEAGLIEFRARRFGPAWEIFLSLAQKGDRPSGVYVEVCEQYRRTPPPEEWEGSYQMEHK